MDKIVIKLNAQNIIEHDADTNTLLYKSYGWDIARLSLSDGKVTLYPINFPSASPKCVNLGKDRCYSQSTFKFLCHFLNVENQTSFKEKFMV